MHEQTICAALFAGALLAGWEQTRRFFRGVEVRSFGTLQESLTFFQRSFSPRSSRRCSRARIGGWFRTCGPAAGHWAHSRAC